MDTSRPSPHLASPVELKRRIEAERAGDPFMVYRDAEGDQRIVALAADRREATIGRDGECDLMLDWDEQVSGLHAELRRSAGH